jgi:hypothetical protein
MTWTNTNGDSSLTRPTRVRLPDRTTRTMEAVTDEILLESGWSWTEPVEYLATSGTFFTSEGSSSFFDLPPTENQM